MHIPIIIIYIVSRADQSINKPNRDLQKKEFFYNFAILNAFFNRRSRPGEDKQ